MLCERIKSRPAQNGVGKAECSIRGFGEEEWGSIKKNESMNRSGIKLALVLSLHPASETEGLFSSNSSTFHPISGSATDTNFTIEGKSRTPTDGKNMPPESQQVPVYHLATFFESVLLPPTSYPAQSSSTTAPASADSDSIVPLSGSSILLGDIAQSFNDTIGLFRRREERVKESQSEDGRLGVDSSQGEAPVEAKPHQYFAIYSILPSIPFDAPATSSIASSLDHRQVDEGAMEAPLSRDGGSEEIVPLLMALWRCKLWIGEGWTGSE